MSEKTKVRFWYPDRQYLSHKEEIDTAIHATLERGDLILRQDLSFFEENLAKFLGVSHVIGVASGTDALLLSLKACGIKRGDEVLVPSYTFRATVEAVHHAGAVPIPYDLDGSYQHLISHRTAAIIPAHLEGQVRDDMVEMVEFARQRGIHVIEDACQAIGAPVTGTTACYSFYPAKILGCLGDGGAIATNHPSIADHLRKMRNHYKGAWGEGFGFNSRLDNIQAAVLNVKLRHLPQALKRRKEIAERYDRELMNVGLPQTRAIYQDYIITIPESEGLVAYLADQGIEAMRNFYPFPDKVQKGPLATAYEAASVRLPCTPEHTNEEIGRVIEAVNAYARK